MQNHDIIIVRGAPGVGKSTLASGLLKHFKNGVTIEIGTVLKMINTFEDGNSKQYSDALENSKILAISFLKKGYRPILIIGPMKAERIEQHFLPILKDRLKYTVITLLASEKELASRIDKRVGGFKNKLIAYKVNADMHKKPLSDNILINTSDKNTDDVLLEVKAALHI